MLFLLVSELYNKNGWLVKWVDVILFVNWIDKDVDLDFVKYELFLFSVVLVSYEVMSCISFDEFCYC